MSIGTCTLYVVLLRPKIDFTPYQCPADTIISGKSPHECAHSMPGALGGSYG